MTPEQLLQHLTSSLPATGCLWVGFSGGLDSSVLLHALSRTALKPRLKALHVHHGLSANADAWLAHCHDVCEQLDVELVAERVTLDHSGDGIEEAARRARYQAFARHLQHGDVLLLAHHADDQIETFFQRLLRGSGLQGLTAMAAEREWLAGVRLMRPLLPFSRTSLEAVAQQWQLSWVDDESNFDERLERNWWRQTLLPQVFARFPHKKPVVLRSLQQLQQDQAMLQRLLLPYAQACLTTVNWPLTETQALNTAAVQALDDDMRPYVIRHWLACAGVLQPSAQWLATLMNEVLSAAPDRQPQLVLGNLALRRFRNLLCLTHTAQAEPDCRWDGCTSLHWAGGQLQLQPAAEGLMEQGLMKQGLKPGAYRVTAAENVRGLTLTMKERPAKGLKALFQEAGVPVWLREVWPAIVADEATGLQLVALPGIGISRDFLVEGGLQPVWSR